MRLPLLLCLPRAALAAKRVLSSQQFHPDLKPLHTKSDLVANLRQSEVLGKSQGLTATMRSKGVGLKRHNSLMARQDVAADA
ncbi:hypothetical protein [Primorskyibacter marinus]|uniref:hypothetical protein n=1 Tax=Primorskyibacter marinus TaxID=1977320 RepID=UPI000E3033CC|nr:hypothetical protein [Primorskyibacter marinus]